MQFRSRLYWLALGAIVTAAVGLGWWSSEQKRQQKAEARAVSVLPAGVQKKWEAFVARRLAKVIVPDGSQLRLIDFLGDATVVSINMPYSVSCEVLGGSVDFGSGDDAITVSVFGVMATDRSDPEPALGVDMFSVAAERLNTSLCKTVVTYMRSVTEQ